MEEVTMTRAETTWLEVLGRHGDVVARQRIDGDVLTLGRAFDNDVVLDDPHVAAHHLRLVRGDDGRWNAEDLGSVNGLRIDNDAKRRERVALAVGTLVRVGHTGLRLRSSAESLPAELPLAQRRSPWPPALAAVALVVGLALLELWLGETGEPKLTRYLAPVLSVVAALAIWTTLWSVLTRVFSGHARFGLHLLIAGAGLLAFSLYDSLADIGSFSLSWTALSTSRYVVGWLVFAATCFFHLRAMSPKRLPLKAIALGVLAALGITMQTLKMSEWRAASGQAETLKRLQPPTLRIVGAQPEKAFFDAAAALKPALDSARSKEPSGDEGVDSDE